jgi:hypothetical protein
VERRFGGCELHRFQTLHYGIAGKAPFRYYRLNVTANKGDASTQLSEFGLFADPDEN